MTRASRCGCRTSATAGTASTSRTTATSTSPSTTGATPRRCSRWTTASAASSTLLRERRLLDSTLVVYMGDNGFAFGEHGLIDKRTAYEESMRVPLLMHCPGCRRGATVEQVVANIDIAPTILEAAGLRAASAHRRPELPAARARRARALARHAALRVLLGAQLPADADDPRAARRPLQVHPLPRHLGHRRALRPAGRSARDAQPDSRSRARETVTRMNAAALRGARGDRRHGHPAAAGPRRADSTCDARRRAGSELSSARHREMTEAYSS